MSQTTAQASAAAPFDHGPIGEPAAAAARSIGSVPNPHLLKRNTAVPAFACHDHESHVARVALTCGIRRTMQIHQRRPCR